MIKYFIIWVALNFIPALAGEKDCSHDSHNFRCVEVLKNYDGDTITVNIPNVHPLLGEKISVRILGIDTPEIRTTNECEKKAGRIARNLVSNILMSAKKVDLVAVQRDKYFRVLGNVIADGKSLKDILLKNKLAYSYDGGTKQNVDWCPVSRGTANEK
jgi:endonuclease YncB( thermonuclease family)